VIGGALSSIAGTADQYVFGFGTASFVPTTPDSLSSM
jgi:hypothetical protein